MRDRFVRAGRVKFGINERDVFFQRCSRPKRPRGFGRGDEEGNMSKNKRMGEPNVENEYSETAFEKERETSVDGSDQAAISSEHLHPLSIFLPGRPGLAPLDAVPLRTAFFGPETEVEAGDEEDPVQRCTGPRVFPREFFCFWREHVQRVCSPRPRIVPFREHSGVNLWFSLRAVITV